MAKRCPPLVRRLLDLAILFVILLGVIFYLPRLLGLVQTIAEAEPESGQTANPAYARGMLYLGLLPLVGSIGMLVPCLSFFRPPLPPARRTFLAVLCLVPLGLATWGGLSGPERLHGMFARLGVLCSLGIWVFGLPPVLLNVSVLDLVYRISSFFVDPRERR